MKATSAAIGSLTNGRARSGGATALRSFRPPRGVAQLMYHCALLAPSRVPGAVERNAPLLGTSTLGVEVTEPELAAACGLGNIDPQHSGGDASRAAVEAALDWPLPPPGAILATIRPDADAFGAMAVLSLRAQGRDLNAAALARVSAIAAADRAVSGQWLGPAPLPSSAAGIEAMQDGGHGGAPLAAACADTALDPAARAALMAEWIETGRLPARYRAMARARAELTWAAITSGETRVRPILGGRAALVRSPDPGALRLGYRLAPLVLAVDTGGALSPARKISICQWGEDWADLPALARRLCAVEPGWGGSPTIIGSPQGVGTRLPLSHLLACLRDALKGYFLTQLTREPDKG